MTRRKFVVVGEANSLGRNFYRHLEVFSADTRACDKVDGKLAYSNRKVTPSCTNLDVLTKYVVDINRNFQRQDIRVKVKLKPDFRAFFRGRAFNKAMCTSVKPHLEARPVTDKVAHRLRLDRRLDRLLRKEAPCKGSRCEDKESKKNFSNYQGDISTTVFRASAILPANTAPMQPSLDASRTCVYTLHSKGGPDG